MNNYNIIFFNVESKTEDNGTYEVMNTYNTDSNKVYPVEVDSKKFKLYNNINNVFIGWDNETEFRKLKLKAKYLDLFKAYTFFELHKKPFEDVRSLKELKIKEDIKNLHDTGAMAYIDKKYGLTDKVFALMETTGIGDPNSVYYPTSCLKSYIAENEIPIKSNNDNTNKGYNLGGLNIIGENKRYENLKHFDVNSFYPNMLISLQASSNLDYLNLKCSTVKELTEDWEPVSKTKGTAFYILNDGLKQAKKLSNGEYKILELDSNFDLTENNKDIAKLTNELLQLKENNTGNLRTAYKTLVNGLYGALDSEKYFTYNHVNLMAVTTFLCRYVLYNCYKEFNGVYAKTDSIWTTNKNITEEDLNNYSNDLLNSIGIPNSCIKWELESEPNKLFIKDSNNYIEVIGDEYNFKGSYEAPIQEIALKKAIENKRVDINRLFDDYKDQIHLFCKHPKYSTSQENQDRFNKVLTEIKGYTIEPNKKCYQYFSIHGWVNGLEIDQFNLEVDEDYGLNLITKILYDYGFIKNIHKFNITEKYKAPKFVPMMLKYGENRLIQDNSRLDRLFRTNTNNYSVVERLQKLILPYKANYQYIGFIVGTNYYVIDIDTGHKFDVETVKDEILELFDKTQYILQSSKSNGYHIIFKTDNDLIGFERTSTVEAYEGLELLRNKIVPYNNKYPYKNKQYEYKVMEYNRRNTSNEISALGNLEPFNKTDELKRYYGYDETKKTKEIILVNDNVKDVQELDKLTQLLVELSNLVLDNHHDLSLAIGGSLRGLLNTEDIEQLSKDLEKGTTSKKVTARTIKDGYKGAKPTNSLGLLVKFIEKQPNKNELMEVINMISETIKNNTDNDKNNDENKSIYYITEDLKDKGYKSDENGVYVPYKDFYYNDGDGKPQTEDRDIYLKIHRKPQEEGIKLVYTWVNHENGQYESLRHFNRDKLLIDEKNNEKGQKTINQKIAFIGKQVGVKTAKNCFKNFFADIYENIVNADCLEVLKEPDFKMPITDPKELEKMEVEEQIQYRRSPDLTDEEIKQAQKVQEEIQEKGLITYLDEIIDPFHIGNHKNIYQKHMAGFNIINGKSSYMIRTTAQAEEGKSLEDEIAILKLIPNEYIFKRNNMTLASFSRYSKLNEYYFDRMILYLGDLGNKKAYEKLADLLDAGKILITEYEFIRDLTESKGKGYETILLILKVNSIGLTYQTTQTDFGKDEGAQLETRTLHFTPFEADEKAVLERIFDTHMTITKASKEQEKANKKTLEYHLYLKNLISKTIEIINPFRTVFIRLVDILEYPKRELGKMLALFNAYCTITYFNCDSRYEDYHVASQKQLKEFIDTIYLNNTLAPHELNFVKMLMGIKKNPKDENDKTKYALTLIEEEAEETEEEQDLNPLQPYYNEVLQEMGLLEDLDRYTKTIETLDNNERDQAIRILLQKYRLAGRGNSHIENVFFTVSDNKPYKKLKAYKNIDNHSELLNKLNKKGYLGKLEFKAPNRQNIYYLTNKCNELIREFKIEKEDIIEAINWLKEQEIKPKKE